MITEEKIQRINALAKKSRETGLTPEERDEQTALRQEYAAAFRQSLRSQLDNTYILRPDGSKEAVKKRKKPED